MKIKCKLCGEILDSDELDKEGLNINIASNMEVGFNLGEMSKNLLVLVNHLLTKHPEKALEIYSDLSSKLASVFEMETEEFLL